MNGYGRKSNGEEGAASPSSPCYRSRRWKRERTLVNNSIHDGDFLEKELRISDGDSVITSLHIASYMNIHSIFNNGFILT